jgi:glycosyltransferase involved in cell wall biosynthesis
MGALSWVVTTRRETSQRAPKQPERLKHRHFPKESAPTRVLMSAYACEPGKGSEPGVGWNWVRQIARRHDVWVVTRASNREAIEAALDREPLPRVHWLYVDLPRWARSWKKGTRGLHLYYYLWQIAAFVAARRAHRRVQFDLAHHVTFVNFWMPSLVALLPVPFVWGPVGGGESAPTAFRGGFSTLGRLHEWARDAARQIARLDPLVRLTARRASVGFATTPDTERHMHALGCRSTTVYSEAGISVEELTTRKVAALPRGPFTVISLGRLIHWKGYHLGLRAFAELHRAYPDARYWIVGDGAERPELERLAATLGIEEYVTFFGNVPRSAALEMLDTASVLLHPSLHDSGGWVCLEAMTAGRPVVCLDQGGPGLQVTDETGIKICPTTPDQVVSALAEALLRMAQSCELSAQLGAEGRRRIERFFDWDTKGAFMDSVYASVAADTAGHR